MTSSAIFGQSESPLLKWPNYRYYSAKNVEANRLQPPMFDLHPMRALFLMSQKAFKPPKLKDRKWSKEFNEFIKVSLTKSPKSRPTGEKLLTYPFVTQQGIIFK